MLEDYTDMMNQYTETMEELKDMKEDLTDEELIYYTKVMNRINEKMLEVSLEMD